MPAADVPVALDCLHETKILKSTNNLYNVSLKILNLLTTSNREFKLIPALYGNAQLSITYHYNKRIFFAYEITINHWNTFHYNWLKNYELKLKNIFNCSCADKSDSFRHSHNPGFNYIKTPRYSTASNISRFARSNFFVWALAESFLSLNTPIDTSGKN